MKIEITTPENAQDHSMLRGLIQRRMNSVLRRKKISGVPVQILVQSARNRSGIQQEGLCQVLMTLSDGPPLTVMARGETEFAAALLAIAELESSLEKRVPGVQASGR